VAGDWSFGFRAPKRLYNFRQEVPRAHGDRFAAGGTPYIAFDVCAMNKEG
jgi:hypothetical protein